MQMFSKEGIDEQNKDSGYMSMLIIYIYIQYIIYIQSNDRNRLLNRLLEVIQYESLKEDGVEVVHLNVLK